MESRCRQRISTRPGRCEIALVNELWLVYGLSFAAVVLGVEGLYWLMFRVRGDNKTINRRLALSKRLPSQAAVLDALRQERGFVDLRSPFLSQLNDYVVQTGLRVGRDGLLLWLLGLGGGLLLMSSLMFGLGPLAVLVAIAGAPLIMLGGLAMARRKRIARFAEQLPDAIDVIVRGVRVGHPYAVALDLVARELPDPIGTEFGIVADEVAFGLDVMTATNNLYRRVGQEDLMFLTTTISVQTQTGGNLAEILSRLSQLMRNRSKLRLKIRALTAEGRISGWFLSAMPFVLFGVISLLSPHYFGDVRDHPLIEPALAYMALSLLIGNVVIYRMVNFKY